MVCARVRVCLKVYVYVYAYVISERVMTRAPAPALSMDCESSFVFLWSIDSLAVFSWFLPSYGLTCRVRP
jgi:hypothetical protein